MSMFKKILLVDDDESSNFLNETILSDMDAAQVIEVAQDGIAACDLIGSGSCPELIFLDVRMPRMDGFNFLEKLSTMEVCPHTKIVTLISSTRSEDRQKALQYENVLDYVEKPLTEETVKKISEEYFEA